MSLKTLLKSVILGSLFTSRLVSADITLQPAISGAWTVQGDGQGALINIAEVGGVSVFVATWYAYLNGQQVWMVGSTPIPSESSSITVPVTISNGTGFDSNFQSGDVNRTNWGNLTFSFSSCDKGTLQYNSNLSEFGSGSLSMERLTNTQGLICQDNNNPTVSSTTTLIGRNYDGITVLSEEIFEGTSTLSEVIAPGSTACHLRLQIQNSSNQNKSVIPTYGAYKAGKQIATASGINLLTGGRIPANDTITVEALWTGQTTSSDNNSGIDLCNGTSTPSTTTTIVSCSEIEEIRVTLYSELLGVASQ